MTIQKEVTVQTNFAAGQIDIWALRNDALKIRASGLRSALNARSTAAGAIETRPGREMLFAGELRVDDIRVPSGAVFRLAFSDGKLTIRNADGLLVQTFSSMPWAGATASDVREIEWARIGYQIVIVYRGNRPKLVTFNNDGSSWSCEDFAFDTRRNGALQQPYYRHAARGVTMTPSAYSGAGITVTFSSSGVLTAAHVGARLRYLDSELVVTAVAPGGGSATANITELLARTYNVTVASGAGYAIGDTVEGLTSSVRGQVAAVSGNVVTVVAEDWTGFTVGEKLAGPNASSAISAVATAASPAATTEWDEEMMGAVHGWPASVSVDGGRLIFCRFRDVPNAIAWSALQQPKDFYVGAESTDAILETMPGEARVIHVLGGMDQFVLTDTSCYYIPVSADNPIRPGSIEFRLIDVIGSSLVQPQSTAEGVVFVDANSTRVYGLIATGVTARPYMLADLSEHHTLIIKTPVALSVTSGRDQHPERYIYVVNADGTMAVGRYIRGEDFVGWFPWSGSGRAVWVSARVAGATVVASYDIAGATRYACETVSSDSYLDGEMPAFEAAPALDAQRPVGFGPLWFYAGAAVVVRRGALDLGERDVDATGNLVVLPQDEFSGDEVAGRRFTMDVEPFIHRSGEGQSVKQRMRRHKLARVQWTIRGNQNVELDGQIFPAHRDSDDHTVEAPTSIRSLRRRMIGRDFDPRTSLRQPLAGRVAILEFTAEITV
ncbi:hypothetical protein [Blastochloris tepida]|uniref:Uncharacterized protein n=1 Tax=Blastochloris tepida TaxID=2233851 RepID=A0A348FZA5_9HYPH|nr:hypothetical protein [Blastochloris tepida]BBF92638.1 hypothetical protein BLTE_13230 [Blastochloris tepida]